MRKFRLLTTISILIAAFTASVIAAETTVPNQILVKNVHVWDGTSDGVTKKISVLIEGNLVKKLRASDSDANADATIIDGRGRILMPGLIDRHTHRWFQFGGPDSRKYDHAAMGAAAYEGMQTYMSMGYTTLRDVGGNSLSIARALAEGRIRGPRVYSGGGPINGISGHSDLGLLTVDPYESVFQKRGDTNVATGADEVTAAVRTILRQGGTHIKLMPGGGVASNFDPLEATTMTEEELRAAVDAAADFGTYACAHAYTDESVNRFFDAGGRCIEHGFLMSAKTVIRMQEIEAVLSLQAYAGYESFKEPEKIPGFTAENIRKARQVNEGTDRVLGWIAKHNVDTFAGADLWIYNMIPLTPQDMVVRKRWFSNIEILRQNTSYAARWLAKSGPKNPYKEGPLGVIREGAYADMLLVDGNPLNDVTVLADWENNLKLIIKDGKIFKNTL